MLFISSTDVFKFHFQDMNLALRTHTQNIHHKLTTSSPPILLRRNHLS